MTHYKPNRWQLAAVERWNLAVPVGAPVLYTNDLGQVVATLTRSAAWQLGDGTPVVKLADRTGGYDLSRCTPVITSDPPSGASPQ